MHIPELDLLSGLSLRMRFNSHREPQAYVTELPMSIEDVRTELETNKYFREMIAEKASKINL